MQQAKRWFEVPDPVSNRERMEYITMCERSLTFRQGEAPCGGTVTTLPFASPSRTHVPFAFESIAVGRDDRVRCLCGAIVPMDHARSTQFITCSVRRHVFLCPACARNANES